jgi:hypothetical protein
VAARRVQKRRSAGAIDVSAVPTEQIRLPVTVRTTPSTYESRIHLYNGWYAQQARRMAKKASPEIVARSGDALLPRGERWKSRRMAVALWNK